MEIFAGLEHIVRENEPLAHFTSIGIGGQAEYVAEPLNVDELSRVIKICGENSIPLRLLGGGSNVLISDNGIPGMVILLTAPDFCSISVDGQLLTCAGGCRLSHFVSVAASEGLSGPERLVGIPGTVGGALHGNTSAHGADIGQWVRSAKVMTRRGEIIERSKDELNFAYRQSSLDELAIISATFEFEKDSQEDLTKRMQKLWIINKASQPEPDQKSAYIFKDPVGVTANSLIDQAGLKGTRVGEVEIFAQNANFFIAENGATSKDVTQLMDLVISTVSNQFGVDLETSIEIW